MSSETYRDGRLIERADDTTRTVTTWDTAGVQTTRPYTAAENAAADAAIAAQAVQTVRTGDKTAARTLLDAITADIGPKPGSTDVWPTVQTWRTLAAVKRADLGTTTALAQVVVWAVPAILRIARASRKALRLALDATTPDAD